MQWCQNRQLFGSRGAADDPNEGTVMAVHLSRSIHERMERSTSRTHKMAVNRRSVPYKVYPIRSLQKSSSDQSLAVHRNMESHAVCGVCVASRPLTTPFTFLC